MSTPDRPLPDSLDTLDLYDQLRDLYRHARAQNEQYRLEAEQRKTALAFLEGQLIEQRKGSPDDLIADGYHIVHHGMFRDNYEDGSQQWWHYIAMARGDRIYGARGRHMGDALDQIRAEIASAARQEDKAA